MSKAREKGTFAESAVVVYARRSGFPYADRRALAGKADKGDVLFCPGVIAEVKNCAKYDLPGWLRETAEEKENANAAHAFLVVKPKGIGVTRTGDWWAVMYRGWMDELCEEGRVLHVEPTLVLPGRGYISQLPSAVNGANSSTYIDIKPVGGKDLRYWYTVTRLQHMFHLLLAAGYGQLPEVAA